MATERVACWVDEGKERIEIVLLLMTDDETTAWHGIRRKSGGTSEAFWGLI